MRSTPAEVLVRSQAQRGNEETLEVANGFFACGTITLAGGIRVGLESSLSRILRWRLTGPPYPQSLLAMRKLILLSLSLLPLVLHGEAPPLPKDKELKTLVLDTLVAFNKAVQEKNFARFHEERLSSEMRKQYSLEKFTENFQEFVDKGYDISNVAESELVFDTPPAMDSDGVLLLQGYYPTKTNKVTFKLKFINESSGWKIVGINVK